jgi:sulfoxide reductase heme-binding subunit YedZ
LTRAQLVRRVLKPLIWMIGLGIPAWLTWGAFHDALGSDPVETIQRWTGRGALIGLFLTLAITPLRRATGWNELIKLRRLLGLFAFFLGSLHLMSYLVFDQMLSPEEIVKDVMEHPWVLAGFSAWLLMVPLAVTSPRSMVRRLGGARWGKLHRLVYLAAAAGVFHFLWLVKKDVSTPVLFGMVLVVLLVLRLPVVATRLAITRSRPARASTTPGEPAAGA